jgi:hypothetical protein
MSTSIKNEVLFYRVVLSLFLITLILTSKGVYSEFYGFEVLISILAIVNLVTLPKVFESRWSPIVFYFIFVYIVIVVLSTVNNPEALPHSFIYLSLLLLFLINLPSLNNDINNTIKIIKLINKMVLVLIVIFILANMDLYLNGLFFLDKREYNTILSNPNAIGYLVFIGFSFSMLLYGLERKNYYKALIVFYLASLIFIPPVLTAYFSIVSYLIILLYFKLPSFFKLLLVVMLLVLVFTTAVYISDNFAQYQFLFSHRDNLYLVAFEKIQENLLLGNGVENWGVLFLEMKNPHNFILYQALSFGVFAASLYFAFFMWLLYRNYLNMRMKLHKTFYHHIFSQVVVNILVMSVFVAMPGNYQDISILISLIFVVLINASVFIEKSDSYAP